MRHAAAALPACVSAVRIPSCSTALCSALAAAASHPGSVSPASCSTWEQEVRTALTDTWKITNMEFIDDSAQVCPRWR